MKKTTMRRVNRIAALVLTICMVMSGSVFAAKNSDDYTQPKQAATQKYVQQLSEDENVILVLGKYPSCNSCKLDFGQTTCFVIKAECSGKGKDVGGVIWLATDAEFTADEQAAIIEAVQKNINEVNQTNFVVLTGEAGFDFEAPKGTIEYDTETGCMDISDTKVWSIIFGGTFEIEKIEKEPIEEEPIEEEPVEEEPVEEEPIEEEPVEEEPVEEDPAEEEPIEEEPVEEMPEDRH